MDSDNVVRLPVLDYVSFFKLSWHSTVKYWNRYKTNFSQNYNFPSSFAEDVKTNCSILLVDLVAVIVLAILWTSLRIWCSNNIFLPFARYLQLSSQTCAKVPESAWKLIYYSSMWSVSIYVMLLSGRYQYFWDPLSIWDGWHFGMPVPWDIYCIYLIQCSFYLHSVYATLRLDIWRKDSVLMLVHHFLTLSLMGFSYAARHHGVGVLVLLLHDVTDVELEFTKLNVYLKNRDGKFYRINDILADIGFVLFAGCWFWFRLYWYPLKVLYAGLYGAVELAPADIPFIPVFNVMLWILLLMNAYWFHFILLFLYKVATGQMKELGDTREYEEEIARQKALQEDLEKEKQKLSQNGIHATTSNGQPSVGCANGEITQHQLNHTKRE